MCSMKISLEIFVSLLVTLIHKKTANTRCICGFKRSRADSNRCRSFCRALPSHSATRPANFQLVDVLIVNGCGCGSCMCVRVKTTAAKLLKTVCIATRLKKEKVMRVYRHHLSFYSIKAYSAFWFSTTHLLFQRTQRFKIA